MKFLYYVLCAIVYSSLSACHIAINEEQASPDTLEEETSSDSETPVPAVAQFVIQENNAGFCGADGNVLATEKSGFTGEGYVNVLDEKNTAVSWSVEAEKAGTYLITLRYANNDSTSRLGQLDVYANRYRVSFEPSLESSTWQTQTLSVALKEGVNTLRLTAMDDNGLADIDSLTVSGAGIRAGSCQSAALHPARISEFMTRCEGETSGLTASKIYYVAPDGLSTGNGDSFAAALDFATALSQVNAGEMILLQPGTYTVPYTSGLKNTITFSKTGTSTQPISVVAANCGRAVFDFSFPEQEWVQNSFGFYVTGDHWYFKGIDITRAGYQGAYVTGRYNTFENMAFHHNRNTGFEINKGGSYTTVINSDAYRNYDPKKSGSMADGFGPKQTQGPGNAFYGCRAWENSDDGFDLYDSPEAVVIENSWAFRNGIDLWNYGGFSGNGNGFKLGGKRAVGHHRITGSVAFENVVKGFDQNNNAGGVTVMNNTAYANGTNYGFGNSLDSGEQHVFRNNISLSGPVDVSNADATYNSWDSGPTATASDFISLNVSEATVARQPDGSLPFMTLFRLKAGSMLVDGGIDTGAAYTGAAPDLGAFERE